MWALTFLLSWMPSTNCGLFLSSRGSGHVPGLVPQLLWRKHEIFPKVYCFGNEVIPKVLKSKRTYFPHYSLFDEQLFKNVILLIQLFITGSKLKMN